MDVLIERHYVVRGEKTTRNLNGVITMIDAEQFERVKQRMSLFYEPPCERGLGRVIDNTRHYIFKGSNVLLMHGLVQVGKAVTSDNYEGFRMIRYFANSLDEMRELEKESGLREIETREEPFNL